MKIQYRGFLFTYYFLNISSFSEMNSIFTSSLYPSSPSMLIEIFSDIFSILQVLEVKVLILLLLTRLLFMKSTSILGSSRGLFIFLTIYKLVPFLCN